MEDIYEEDMQLAATNRDVLQEILQAKKGDPSQFPSFWEQDEADIDAPTDEEIQANPVLRLLWAAENDKQDIVREILTENKELINRCDDDGYAALHRASYNGHTDMVKLLLSLGASIDAGTGDGWQPLHCACKWNNTDVASVLIQNSADVNAQTNGGQTPLHLAASEKESRNTLELLLMNKMIDVSLKNQIGDTAFDVCRRTSSLGYLFEIADPSINKL